MEAEETESPEKKQAHCPERIIQKRVFLFTAVMSVGQITRKAFICAGVALFAGLNDVGGAQGGIRIIWGQYRM